MVQRAGFLRQAGYSILLIDFQGTGESEGETPGERVGVIGHSLGGAARLLAPLEPGRLSPHGSNPFSEPTSLPAGVPRCSCERLRPESSDLLLGATLPYVRVNPDSLPGGRGRS